MKPRFLLSRKILKEKYDEIRPLADFVSYSYKTNPIVGQELEKISDCFFSVHTTESSAHIKDKSRIIYFCQGINANEFNAMIESGVCFFVVDNVNDLGVIIKNLENKNHNINLFLRMKLKEHTIHTGKHFVFGFASDMINKLIPELKQNKYIKCLGIHFHRKTQNVAEWSIKQELEETLKTETLKCLDYINIGGGLPVKYQNYEVGNIDAIFSKIKETKTWLNSLGIKMFIEPGRFLAAPCIKLETHIINIYDNNIIINASVYNAAMDTFVANTRLEVEGEKNRGQENGQSYTIKGCTPDSLDIFRYKVYLTHPKIGDKIIFLNAGAYNFSTDFCNLEKIDTIVID